MTGSPTVTVDGRVAATWTFDEDTLTITPHIELSGKQRAAITAGSPANRSHLRLPRGQPVKRHGSRAGDEGGCAHAPHRRHLGREPLRRE